MERLNNGGCSFHVLVSLAQLLSRGGGYARADFHKYGVLHLLGNEWRKKLFEDFERLLVCMVFLSEGFFAHGFCNLGHGLFVNALCVLHFADDPIDVVVSRAWCIHRLHHPFIECVHMFARLLFIGVVLVAERLEVVFLIKCLVFGRLKTAKARY